MMKKARKPRGIKKDGTMSQDMCSCCLSFCCDPMTMSQAWQDKVYRRRQANVCVSCGHNPCRCKSSEKLRTRNRMIARGSLVRAYKNCMTCQYQNMEQCHRYRKAVMYGTVAPAYSDKQCCSEWKRFRTEITK